MAIKTGKQLAKRLKLVFDVQEKTAFSAKIPLFSLRPRNYRFSHLDGVRRLLSKRYASSYVLERKEQRGEEQVYFFRALPDMKRHPHLRQAECVQLRVRPRLLGIR